MSELRTFNIQAHVEGKSGLTELVQLTKAIKDTDAATEALKKQLGEETQVIVTNVKSKKELAKEANNLLNQISRNEKQVSKITEQYRVQTSIIGQTTVATESMLAVARLHSTATDEQRKAVASAAEAYSLAKEKQEQLTKAERESEATKQHAISQTDQLQKQYRNLAGDIGKTKDQLELQNALMSLGAGATAAQRDAVKQAVEQYQKLNRQYSENLSLQKDKVNQERLQKTELDKVEQSVKNLTLQYQQQAKMIDMTANEAEQYRAVMQLGSKATEAQREQVRQSVAEYQRLRDSVGGAQGSFRDARGIMQNFGWQMQDTIVQLQMGTSAFTVLSQQGSQMAAAFGPTGALVGALIALAGVIGGTLFTSLRQSAKATADMAKELDSIASSTEKVGKAQAELKRQQVGADINELSRRYQDLNKYLTQVQGRFNTMQEWSKTTGKALNQEQVRYFNSEILQTTASLEEVEKALKKAGGAQSVLAGGQNTEQLKAFTDLIADLNKEYLSTSDNTEAAKRNTQDLSIMMMGLTDEQQKVVDGLLKRNRAQEDGIEAAKKRAEIEKQELTQFNALNVKLTKTIDDEYKRRYDIIKAYSDNVGVDQKAVAKAYADLEVWKTTELGKEEAKKTALLTREYNAREVIRRQIERAQVTQAKKDDPLQGEMDQFERNLMVLAEQKRQTDALGEGGLAERQRINALIEAEVLRHNSAMEDANLKSFQNTVSVFAMAQTQVASIVNLMTTGVQDVRNQMAEMNGFQKAMFITAQVIAAANAVISGIDLGMKLAAMFPLAAPAMIATGTGIGAAQAGTIMGVTLAGAFDKGGYIPQGQAGIVAEYGNELVNGQLVMGPANVTSREDTAAMMGGSTKLNLSIENRISGAGYQVKQIDENTVRIIAEQVFANNIDQGVSQVIGNGNSKTAKSMRQSYNVQRNLNGN